MDMKSSGFILVNKPVGVTSHWVVDRLRKITGVRRVGHSGTLDPFAEGLLILGVGREATREISKFVKLDKEYIASIELGATSDTEDCEGNIVTNKNVEKVLLKEIEKVVKSFIGEIEQIPSSFSAKKINGMRAYQLARKGREIKLKSSKIKIYNIEILDYKWPNLKIRVKCSSGTYIRALARDVGQKLECGAYLKNLKRTKIGKFSFKNANNLDNLTVDNWQSCLIEEKMII